MSVFETNIRFVGGFLACYALSGDPVFIQKAEETAEHLLPAFQSPTGIPYSLVNINSGVSTTPCIPRNFHYRVVVSAFTLSYCFKVSSVARLSFDSVFLFWLCFEVIVNNWS